MNSSLSPWERRLISRAYDGLNGETPADSLVAHTEAYRRTALLERAYGHCAALTRAHSRTFYLASGLLPSAKRRAVRALYAFCRFSDDLVDRRGGDRQQALERWRLSALNPNPPADDLVAVAWAETRKRHRIPWLYAEDLIDGVARDLVVTRYPSFDALVDYCYGVASTVGLMAMHIIGFSGPEAIAYAVRLGVAMQLTNVLRDVGEDWRAGRVYLPQDEMAAFGISEAGIAAGRADERWCTFIRFQITRARRLYAEALPGITFLPTDGRFAVAAAAELYRAILDDIEAHDGDVFIQRAHLGWWDKVRRLPGIWWRSKTLAYQHGAAW